MKAFKKALLSRVVDKDARREFFFFILAFAIIGWIVGLQGRIQPSIYTWAATLPALAIIFITAIARINDINAPDWVSQHRRLSMAVCAVGAAMWVLIPITPSEPYPTWRSVVTLWGWAGTWFTTPNVGPWWKYISGATKLKKNQEV